MWSSEHTVGSLCISAYIVTVADPYTLTGNLLLLLAGTVIGVGMDVDHFYWSYRNNGTWKHVRWVFDNPLLAFKRQSMIFGERDVSEQERLVSHAALLFVTLLLLPLPGVVPELFGVVAVVNGVVGFHIVCDVYADMVRGG